jgi:nicotinate phosphoribosyltransferase
MGNQYHVLNMHENATFEVFVRKFPKGRKAMVMAGLDDIKSLIAQDRLFKAEDIAYLRGMRDLSSQFVDYLEDLKFTGSIRAFPEGSIFFENEPILQVTAPIIQAQLLETYILNVLGFSISIATKAARIVKAAVLGLRKMGIPTCRVRDVVAGVDPYTTQLAEDQMNYAGVSVVGYENLILRINAMYR